MTVLDFIGSSAKIWYAMWRGEDDSQVMRTSLASVFAFFGLALIVMWFMISIKDPGAGNESPESEFECTICQHSVLATTKHCAKCNKCTPGFDHHCKFLNTDIGDKNKALFISLTASYWLFTLLSIALFTYFADFGSAGAIFASIAFLHMQGMRLLFLTGLLVWHLGMHLNHTTTH